MAGVRQYRGVFIKYGCVRTPLPTMILIINRIRHRRHRLHSLSVGVSTVSRSCLSIVPKFVLCIILEQPVRGQPGVLNL